MLLSTLATVGAGRGSRAAPSSASGAYLTAATAAAQSRARISRCRTRFSSPSLEVLTPVPRCSWLELRGAYVARRSLGSLHPALVLGEQGDAVVHEAFEMLVARVEDTLEGRG